MIMIVGAHGSMGRRYQAILKYFGKKFSCVDIDYKVEDFFSKAQDSTGAIIASPTPTHFEFLRTFARLGVPVLCEKPITKSMKSLEVIRDQLIPLERLNLTMMMQYKMLDDINSEGPSSYNYFRHGQDGLTWDCLQIIGLARGPVDIQGTSPIWSCTLNGKKLSLADMDKAYVDFVFKWLERPGDDINRLIDIHKKVMDWENGKKY